MAGRSQVLKSQRQGRDSSGRIAPSMATLPTVAGTNTVGQTLTGTNGTFDGTATITITRQWTRRGAPISGATGATYVLQEADVGTGTIRFQNIGTSPYGVARSDSAARTIAAA